MTTNTIPNLNTKQVCKLFGVCHMTVRSWRDGNERRKPLPILKGKSSATSVEFQPEKLKAWAEKYGIVPKADPVEFATGKAKVRAARKRIEH